MPQVKFSIKGLAACYRKVVEGRKEDAWTIDFPTGGKHLISAWISKSNGEQILLGNLAGKIIQIDSSNSIRPTEFEDDKFRDHVLDLTSDDLHKEGLIVKQNKPVGRGVTTIKIQNATLTSNGEREDRLNFVFPKCDITKLKPLSKMLSKEIGGSVEISEGGQFTLIINGVRTVLQAADTLCFDNDCHQISNNENDFQLYQEIYSNLNSESEYMIWTYDYKKITENIIGEIAKSGWKNEASLFNKILENITIMSETPPIFCDPITIGKPEGLS